MKRCNCQKFEQLFSGRISETKIVSLEIAHMRCNVAYDSNGNKYVKCKRYVYDLTERAHTLPVGTNVYVCNMTLTFHFSQWFSFW